MRWALLAALLVGCSFEPPAGPGDGMSAGTSDAFEVTRCSMSYSTTLASVPSSRYRIITSNAVFRSQSTACNENTITHLAAIESEVELTELSAVLKLATPPPSQGRFYVGAVQQRSASAPNVGWSWLIGGSIQSTMWGAVFQGTPPVTIPQPNDADGTEDNGENLAVIEIPQSKLLDASGTNGYGAVCECDGKAIDATIAANLP